jgi:hypothetical protein
MTVTTSGLTKAAGAAAAAAGALFIGIQIGHPHLDATSIQTTEVVVRDTLKVVMAALALAGLTGMYLSQVRRNGVLGLVGWLVLSAGYLLIMGTAFTAAFVLPEIADANQAYVNDVIDVTNGRTSSADIGAMVAVNQIQGIAYLAGGLLFGIALFRARVLTRWATLLLAAGGVVTAVLSFMPDAFYRLLAFPNGIAMIALGIALWRSQRQTAPATATTAPAAATSAPVEQPAVR